MLSLKKWKRAAKHWRHSLLNETTREKDLLDQIDLLQTQRDTFAKALSESTSVFKDRVKELSIIKRIGDSMRWNSERSEVCKGIVDIIIDEMPAENCSLWFVNNEVGSIELRAARGQKDRKSRYFTPDEPAFLRLAIGEGLVGRVAATGESLLVNDVAKCPYHLDLEEKSEHKARSILSSPVSRGGKVTGVINLSHPQADAFSNETERLLGIIAGQASLSFTNLALHERLQGLNDHLEDVVIQRTNELKFSETKYRLFVENAGSAIVICQKDGKIVEANSEACKLLKLSKGKTVGSPFSDLLNKRCAEEVMDVFNTGCGRFNGLALKGDFRNGAFVDINANAISTEEGSFIYLIIHDVTYQTNLEKKLKSYSDHLEEIVAKRTKELEDAHQELLLATKLAAIGELASSVAHEINNPLTVINGYVEDMLEVLGSSDNGSNMDSKEMLERLSIISSQADRCKNITRSLLNFARKREVNIVPLEINYVILQAVHFASHREHEMDITFESDTSDDLPYIKSDMSMIEQVLLNVYGNAVDAIDSTGKSGTITTQTYRNKAGVDIVIKDTGIGMLPEVIANIFDPFYTTKPTAKGTGLGLSICKKLIERLGGSISVQSVPGEGSQFLIFLPKETS